MQENIYKKSYYHLKEDLKKSNKHAFWFIETLELLKAEGLYLIADRSIRVYKNNALLTYISLEFESIVAGGKPNGILKKGTTDDSINFISYVLKHAIEQKLTNSFDLDITSKWKSIHIFRNSKTAKQKFQLLLDSILSYKVGTTVQLTNISKENKDFQLNAIELTEGKLNSIKLNVYERNSKARQICLTHFGYSCMVCGFDFEKTYGSIGQKFIHVHHLKQISTIKKKYIVDPIKDLIPICPNCHNMIHRSKYPLAIEELKSMIKKNCM